MTISIPEHLKVRMDRVGGRVNWSAVARAAFEAKVADLAARERMMTMQDIAMRLRSTLDRDEDDDFRAGEQIGSTWAARFADAKELERLQIVDAGTPHPLFSDDDSSAYSPGEHLVFVVRPDFDGDRGAAHDFWSDFGPDSEEGATRASFVNGFVEGALSVWRLVSPFIGGAPSGGDQEESTE